MIMNAGTPEIAGHANILEILAKVDVAVLKPQRSSFGQPYRNDTLF